MLELSVSAKSPAAITAAFKKIREMVMTGAVSKDTPVHLILEPGIYQESVRYNLSNPLVMESHAGTKTEDCVIQAENCESFHHGAENRAIFVAGPNCTSVVLKGFSIINTHIKSSEGNTTQDAAEAFFWNNTNGTLVAENMSFESRQNTLFVKGFSEFTNCNISGDTDFIYGDCDTAYFENCRIYVREDNRGDYSGYAVKSLAFARKSGFVFVGCKFEGEKRKKSDLYLYRTAGLGSALAPKMWDSMALINCTVSDVFNPEFFWDDDMNLNVYPRGNAKNGLREYNTLIVHKGGTTEEADTSRRNIKSYRMTQDEYVQGYASRYLILHDTPFAKTME